ncbi:MAG: small multi-drug export protein [Bacilli bacterium]|nr:small multi-drug export protein [Bacilli bacterium]
MTETLVEFFLNIFSGISSSEIGKSITVFIVSMLPIIELRGGLIAAALLDLSLIKAFIICFLANIIPIPFILWLIRKVIDWMRKIKCFKKFVKWLDKKVENKKGQIEKYGFWGIVAFVGIPLPGTGAWTGSLIAAMLDMDKKKAFLAAVLGVFIAGIIMAIFSYGVLDLIF